MSAGHQGCFTNLHYQPVLIEVNSGALEVGLKGWLPCRIEKRRNYLLPGQNEVFTASLATYTREEGEQKLRP